MSADPNAGLRESAARRHPSVKSAARWLEVNSRLQGDQLQVAGLFRAMACDLLEWIDGDDPELTRALVLLTQAKDAAVRASIADAE